MTNLPRSIGIAIVEHEGRYLVGVRGDEGPLAGYAEFPGGKCREGEAPRACAVRECLEETGLSVVAHELLLNRRHAYEHATVDLSFWLCGPADPEDVADDHRGFRWIDAVALTEQRFPEANGPVLEMLLGRYGA